MPHTSAGILLYRLTHGAPEVFLVHPGGPYWARRDEGAWSIPKGEFTPPEDALAAAQREFAEETGVVLSGSLHRLEPVRQAGGKLVHAWACEGDCDHSAIRGNPFTMEWPPHSGRQATFPEVDRAAWFTLTEARKKMLPGQRTLLTQLERLLKGARTG